MTRATHVPGPGWILAAAQTLVTWLGKTAQKSINGLKRYHRDTNNEATGIGHMPSSVLCSAFFLPFFSITT